MSVSNNADAGVKAVDKHLTSLSHSEIARSREAFMGRILKSLSGNIEDIVGLEDAQSFVSQVGLQIGEEWGKEYRAAFGRERLSVEEIAAALLDLKSRISGSFEIVSIDDRRIVLKNGDCPFGENVLDRPSMCQMTSSVFGRIVADNLGYARVSIPESIAKGDARCLVVIDLDDTGSCATHSDEYFSLAER